jgi:hypothetical protein
MNEIIEPTMNYDFSKLTLCPPTSLAGGHYFTKLLNTNKPLFIQTPKSLTKQGFVKSGKKVYVDLMFDNNDTIFINWIENLESMCQDLLSKQDSWFQTKIEKDDIETAFTSSFKIFKSGKHYLLRVNVKPNIKIYDELDKVVSLETITNDKTLISIVEIQGIKFTSRNFQIEYELKQSMVVSPDPFLDECFIKKPTTTKKENSESIESIINDSVLELTKQKEDFINLEVSFNEDIKKPVKQEQPNENLIDAIDVNEFDIEGEDLKEVTLDDVETLETMTLKQPNQVYYEMYQSLKEKAKIAKKKAIEAYVELSNIKQTYMLDIDESDEEFEEYVSNYANL